MYATAPIADFSIASIRSRESLSVEDRIDLAEADIYATEFPNGLEGKDISEAIGEISDADFDRLAALYKEGDRAAFANLMFSKIAGYWEGWINDQAAKAAGLK